MSTESSQVFDAAMALPDGSRADLAYKLLQSLKPAGVPSADNDELATELERRVKAYENGETSAADWDDVSARLQQALKTGDRDSAD